MSVYERVCIHVSTRRLVFNSLAPLALEIEN